MFHIEVWLASGYQEKGSLMTSGPALSITEQIAMIICAAVASLQTAVALLENSHLQGRKKMWLMHHASEISRHIALPSSLKSHSSVNTKGVTPNQPLGYLMTPA